MTTQCTSTQLEFQPFGRRNVVGRFDGGRLTSDAGGLLLREVNQQLDLLPRRASCFTDHRHAGLVEHSVGALLAQRLYGLALGYEDINDHDELRTDSLLALLVGKAGLTGAGRARVRDRGYPLAGSSTLNRLELGTPEQAAEHRYQKIVADPEGLDRLLVDVFLESQRPAPALLWLDLDATDDPLQRSPGGTVFSWLLQVVLLPAVVHLLRGTPAGRPANVDAAAGSVTELARIIGQIRRRWPDVTIILRGDSGFCREELMGWCEANGVGYLLGQGTMHHHPGEAAETGRVRAHQRPQGVVVVCLRLSLPERVRRSARPTPARPGAGAARINRLPAHQPNHNESTPLPATCGLVTAPTPKHPANPSVTTTFAWLTAPLTGCLPAGRRDDRPGRR